MAVFWYLLYTHPMNQPLSYIELSKANLIHNVQSFRSLLAPGTKIAGVIKANAYGHGQNEVAQIIEPYVDYFQVDDIEELHLLRKTSSKAALVLGYVAKADLEEAVRLDGILAIYDLERLTVLNEISQRLNKKPIVHLKIDTYLGRQGILLEELETFFQAARQFSDVTIEGIYSHFANIEDTSDFSHAQKQLESFQRAQTIAKQYGYDLLTHISATSGILAYEKNQGQNAIVRLGIGLYGLWPSTDLQQQYQNQIQLKSAMRWVTHVAQVKTVPANYSIGYGLTYITDKPTKIAIIPQGYSDGYDRGLSNTGEVLISGKRCQVLGRVAMNMFVADVTKLDSVEAEDEVILLGQQGNEVITAEELATKIDTINYEITTRVSPLLPRAIG